MLLLRLFFVLRLFFAIFCFGEGGGWVEFFFNDLMFFVFRAVYLNTDIYLLDDIFSCVDNPTRQDMMKGSVTQTSLMVVD